MKITIEYCTLWNYKARAAGLAAEIRKAYPHADIELVTTTGGRFEVYRDGMPVFEKSKIGRHAKPGEVLELLAGAHPT